MDKFRRFLSAILYFKISLFSYSVQYLSVQKDNKTCLIRGFIFSRNGVITVSLQEIRHSYFLKRIFLFLASPAFKQKTSLNNIIRPLNSS